MKKKTMEVPMNCQHCDKPTIKKNWQQKYCSACSNKIQRIKDKARKEAKCK